MPVARSLLSLLPCVIPSPETAARVEEYAARVAAGLGVFEPPPAAPEPTRCWACGAVPPQRSHVYKLGWATRTTNILDGYMAHEIYCGLCFERWGWPDAGERQLSPPAPGGAE